MCYSPKIIPIKSTFVVNSLYGYHSPNYSSDGKLEVSLPCGKCDDCRVSHSKEWALRCMLEYSIRSKKEKDNCWFVTLTYDDYHLPMSGKLCKSHYVEFIKKIRHYFERKDKSVKIKYFICGEYGTKNYRPHYHMLVYGLPLKDLEFFNLTGKDNFLFISDFLNSFWKKGFVVIGKLNYQTAFYTARYTLKKIGDTDIFMSCSNGFGKNWCLKNIKNLINDGYLRFAGFNYSIPRYFCKLIRSYFNDDFKYVDWCKMKKSNFIKSLNKLSVIYKTGEYFFDSDDIKLKNRFLKDGRLSSINECSETEKISRRNKSIIRQSIYELFKERENFVKV